MNSQAAEARSERLLTPYRHLAMNFAVMHGRMN
jgi:hypothetical protein